LLSKRKLTWFVEEKLVSGWDDPRFPTVRGIRRRGMTIDALIAYILSQGASQRELMLEWDKIWAINKKIIDPISPRHTSLIKDQLVSVNVVDDVKFHAKNLPKHKKNAEIGEKVTTYGKKLFLAQKDCIDLEVGEEVTFMDWGNVIVKSIEKAGDVIKKVEITLNLDGDFKKTKKKLTWLCPGEKGEHELSELNLYYYDYLITKKKLEGDEEIKDILNTKSVSIEKAVGDSNLKLLKNGDIIQLEREGYFICDKPSTAEDPAVHLIYIPDGKIESVSLRNTSGTESKVEKPQKRVAVTEKSVSSNMYPAKPFYEDISGVEKDNSNMYRCAPYYPDLLNAPTPSKKEKKKKEPKPVAAAAEPEGEGIS
jgi:glutamyl-tRNA synthetase